MAVQRNVLVVDPSDETHEVLRSILGERGVNIVSARNTANGLALARQSPPSLIVLDLENDGSSSVVTGRLVSESAAQATPLLVLGTAKSGGRLAGCQFFSKPYHYAPLIRKIEELLGSVVDGAGRDVDAPRRCDAKAA